jgi:hypothetical protein
MSAARGRSSEIPSATPTTSASGAGTSICAQFTLKLERRTNISASALPACAAAKSSKRKAFDRVARTLLSARPYPCNEKPAGSWRPAGSIFRDKLYGQVARPHVRLATSPPAASHQTPASRQPESTAENPPLHTPGPAECATAACRRPSCPRSLRPNL